MILIVITFVKILEHIIKRTKILENCSFSVIIYSKQFTSFMMTRTIAFLHQKGNMPYSVHSHTFFPVTTPKGVVVALHN